MLVLAWEHPGLIVAGWLAWLITLLLCLLLAKLFDRLVLLSFITTVLILLVNITLAVDKQYNENCDQDRIKSQQYSIKQKKTIIHAWNMRGHLSHAHILERSSRILLYTRVFSPHPPDVQELSPMACAQHSGWFGM